MLTGARLRKKLSGAMLHLNQSRRKQSIHRLLREEWRIPRLLPLICNPWSRSKGQGGEPVAYFISVYKSELPHRAKSVYMYLHDRADKEGKCYPAIGTIARELNLSRSTVKRAITDLEKQGYLRKEQRWRENGGKSSNLYFLSARVH